MLIGYARASTEDQDLALQIAALRAAGCERIYEDKKSGKNLDRPGWRDCRMDLREGDTLVIWKLDRLGRSALDLINLLDEFRKQGIDFICTTQGLDTRTPIGNFTFQMFAAFAELERSMIAERTKAGIEQARERGFVPGPVPRITPDMWDYAVKAWQEKPKLTVASLCRMIHEDVQVPVWENSRPRPKEKPKKLTTGSIHNIKAELKAGEPYPEHWRERLKQRDERLQEQRKQGRSK